MTSKFEKEFLKTTPQATQARYNLNGSTHSNVPEIYGYNVTSDQDPDILNQGTIDHIKRYFEKKEKESQLSQSQDQSITIIEPEHASSYDINNCAACSVIIKIIIVILFLWILCDFISHEKIN